MDAQDIQNKLESVGHIKVVFEPDIYLEDRIPKRRLEDVLNEAAVSLRGWNYPHIPIQDKETSKRPYSIGSAVEFYTHWDKFIEIFRLYQSGQFLAKTSLFEDTLGQLRGKDLPPGKYLDFLGLIYRITEINLFISNLITATDIQGGRLFITISKTRDRELESIFDNNIMSFMGGYVCRMNEVEVQENFDREKILNQPLIVAREIIKKIFEDFNWKNYSETMIQTHQENFVNRRI